MSQLRIDSGMAKRVMNSRTKRDDSALTQGNKQRQLFQQEESRFWRSLCSSNNSSGDNPPPAADYGKYAWVA